MKEFNFDKVMFAIICVVIILGVAFMIIKMFAPQKAQNITFNVVGIANNSNSSLVSVHLECIKYCTDKLAANGLSYMNACYQQCEGLGK